MSVRIVRKSTMETSAGITRPKQCVPSSYHFTCRHHIVFFDGIIMSMHLLRSYFSGHYRCWTGRSESSRVSVISRTRVTNQCACRSRKVFFRFEREETCTLIRQKESAHRTDSVSHEPVCLLIYPLCARLATAA